MTHTSPELEELRLLDDLATVLWAKRVEIAAARLKPQPSGELTRASAHGLASEVFAWMHRVGYRRLPINQARVGEIRERHEHHAAMRKLLAAKNEPAGWAYKAHAMNAECFDDRAYLLSLLEDTKVEAPAGAPAEQGEAPEVFNEGSSNG